MQRHSEGRATSRLQVHVCITLQEVAAAFPLLLQQHGHSSEGQAQISGEIRVQDWPRSL